MRESHNQTEDVIMAIEASWAIGANVENLWELEGVFVVHAEDPSDKDKHAPLNWSLLHILVVNLVLNVLEAEGFDFLFDFRESPEYIAVVGHDTMGAVEVQ